MLFQNKQETLHVVTIAMICSIFTLNISIFSGGLDVTQSNIYGGAFIVEIVSR